ncbi:MAG: hypothetical protein DRQ40_04040 [Gammaproteobacteria bacterium]|nr:MAG: hypothetical protein DRQ40_04040 [Gammaproteobacteria bacterium]
MDFSHQNWRGSMIDRCQGCGRTWVQDTAELNDHGCKDRDHGRNTCCLWCGWCALCGRKPPGPPMGFVEMGSKNDTSGMDLEKLKAQHDKIPCILYTDRVGHNFFLINQRDKMFILPVRTS